MQGGAAEFSALCVPGRLLMYHVQIGMSCPSCQWHRTGSSWFPVRTLPVAPLWYDLGFFPNSHGNKAVANLLPIVSSIAQLTFAVRANM